jgi:hypothetical protein
MIKINLTPLAIQSEKKVESKWKVNVENMLPAAM